MNFDDRLRNLGTGTSLGSQQTEITSPLGDGRTGRIKAWKNFFEDWWSCRQDDVIVISYPKSGRTWHRVWLSHYIAAFFGKRQANTSIDTRQLSREFGGPLISYSHNGANFVDAIPPEHYLNGYLNIWRGRKIILLVRDPRDVLVSSYHHARYRSASFVGSLSQFIRHPYTGIDKLLVAHQRWARFKELSAGTLVQSYEGMHRAPKDSLIATLEFSGIPVDEAIADATLKFGSFENMKELESSGFFQARAISVSKGASAEARKVREGRIGSYLGHFTSDDLSYVHRRIDEIGYPFWDYIRYPAKRSRD